MNVIKRVALYARVSTTEVKRLVPNRPEGAEIEKIRAIGGAAADAFVVSNEVPEVNHS
jgi:hypothetical protein